MTVTAFSSTVWAADETKGKITKDVPGYATVEDTNASYYLFKGESFKIAETLEGHYGILLQNDELVYIEKEYIAIEENKAVLEENKEKEEVAETPSKGEELVEYAKEFIGLAYKSGGTSLKSGVDCSGFTQQIYKKFDISLERSSRDQYATNGTAVTKDKLLPGDLVFYGVNGTVRHVAIYVGDNKIIHAPVPGKSVCIAPLSQRGDDPIIGYKRIF